MPSNIEWTEETWNPVTGCSRVSPGCDHCYMFREYPRLRAMSVPGYDTAPDQVTLLPQRLEIPKRWKRPRRVFVNSMSDLFHQEVPFPFIDQVFETMREASTDRGHTFQVLTKRPGRAVAWWKHFSEANGTQWPPDVWLGTSVETQRYAPRITVLERIRAAVRFISAEPLLGPLDLTEWFDRNALKWVINGGESGVGARPMELEWAASLRDQCIAANTPFFLKQLCGERNKRGGDAALLDGQRWTQMPIEAA